MERFTSGVTLFLALIAVGMAGYALVALHRIDELATTTQRQLSEHRLDGVQLEAPRNVLSTLRGQLAKLQQKLDSVENSYEGEHKRDDRFARSIAMRLRIQEVAWTDTEDAPLQIRMVAGPGISGTSHSVQLLGELRNKSDHECTVAGLRSGPWPFSVKLFHDGAPMRFRGPSVFMPPPPPIVLLPGEITAAEIELMPMEYSELNQPGVVTAEWTYVSSPDLTSQPKVTWTGTLTPVKALWRIR
jgi:hypothetical protein